MRAQTPGRNQPTAGVAQIVLFQLEKSWALPLALVARFHDPEIVIVLVVVIVIVMVDDDGPHHRHVPWMPVVGIETCRWSARLILLVTCPIWFLSGLELHHLALV